MNDDSTPETTAPDPASGDIYETILVRFQGGELLEALAECDRLLELNADDADARALRGEILADIGHLEAALLDWEHAQRLEPDWLDGYELRAGTLLELGRLDEAEAVLVSAPEASAELAWIHGILAEFRGHDPGEHYATAARLDPEVRVPYTVDEEAFFALALASWNGIPEEFRRVFENIDIRVKDLPPLDRVREPESGISALVLGFFEGQPLPHRGGFETLPALPAQVFLFQKNIQRLCHDADQLAEQIDITLRHELGHFLGLDEHDMVRLGID